MTLSATTLRTAVAALTAALLGTTVATLWQFGSTPTDENVFMQPPSGVVLVTGVAGEPASGPSAAGDPAGGGPRRGEPMGSGPDGRPAALALRPGDLVVRVAGTRVFTPADYAAALEDAPARVRVEVVRTDPRDRVAVETDADALRRAQTRDVRTAAFVIDVTPGGASARAGMRMGDLIVRINGRTFTSVLEADAILRAGTVGHATEYQVLRGNDLVTLRVTLASFGLRVSLFLFSVAGMVFMLFGAFLAMARPRIPAARYLGLAFVTVGYALSVLLLRRAYDAGLVVTLRDVTLALAVFMGVALVLHAGLYFPRERPSLLARRWVLPVGYALAAVSAALTLARGNDGTVLVVLGANLVYLAVVRALGRRDSTPELRRMVRPLEIVTWTVAVLVVLGLAGLIWPVKAGPDPGYAGLLLIAIPAAHLWVIGRHRLLDLNLRLRRHVQYSLVSTAWGAIPLVALIWIVLTLAHVHLPIPHVRLTGPSVEVLGTPLDTERRAAAEKVLLMAVGIALAFGLRKVARRGEQWIASKFYRADHDYRRAAQEVTGLVTARPDLEGLSTGLLQAVVRLLQVKRAGIVFVHQGRTYCPSEAHGFTADHWSRLCRAAADVVEGIRRAKAEVAAEYLFPRLRRLLSEIDALYLFPLRSHDELVGAIVLGEKLAEDAFRDEDFEFLGALASQVAPSVENAFLYSELAEQERLKHEFEIARRIQMESLPQFTPLVPGLDVAGVSIPAFEVGGDYFDYLNGHPQRLTVVVGDVSGKGTSAALYMSKLQGIVRSLHAFDLAPHELFVRTNDLLCRDLERRSFVTAIGGFFDTAAHEMVLARAGHLPLYYYASADRTVHRLLPGGLGMGFSTRPVFERYLQEHLIHYHTGDVFLFITDGITECFAPSGDDFGEERVLGLLQRHAAGSAQEIRDQVTAAVRAFSGTAEQFDDQTVVVVKVTG